VAGGLLFAFGVLGMLIGGTVAWTAASTMSSTGDGEVWQARRFRAARRANAEGARDGEEVAILVRVVEPPGGVIPGWGTAGAAWTRLAVEGRSDLTVERGQILVEDDAGSVIGVEARGLSITGLAAPGIEPTLRWAFGTKDQLPAPLVEALHENGAALGTARLSVQTEQLVPGETLWLVGPIHRLDGQTAGALLGSLYRERGGAASFASDDRGRFLVRAETEEQATSLLAARADAHVGARRWLSGSVALLVVGFAMCVYAFAK
jgi:hypothetical protein